MAVTTARTGVMNKGIIEQQGKLEDVSDGARMAAKTGMRAMTKMTAMAIDMSGTAKTRAIKDEENGHWQG